jgi:hypothetical protein
MRALPYALLYAALLPACAQTPAGGGASPGAQMTFFVTSTGLGRGADLGGLAGADKHCQTLAEDVGAGARTWRAYLSTSAQDGTPAVNARDRIGPGPWRNAKGTVIADSVAQLHQDNRLTKQTALTEKGDVVNGSGDTPNMHDILTGTQADGTAYPASGNDMTCRNWTHSGEGTAMVGHSDRTGLDDSAAAKSWNTSHPTRGCSQDALKATGGAGLFYCFAAR